MAIRLFLILSLFPAVASAQVIYRDYGAETTFDFGLREIDNLQSEASAACASGDVKIMKDEGTEANATNCFVDEGQGYSLTLTATEMEAARIVVYVVDQGTKDWLDHAIFIETTGDASAQHATELTDARIQLLDNLDAAISTRSTLTATQVGDIEVEPEGSIPLDDAISYILAIVAGETADAGLTFKTPDGAATRVEATTNDDNERTSITLTDPTP